MVRPDAGSFRSFAGARRYRAAQRAGLKEIPVRIGAFTDAEALEIQMIENIQRADVHPFEEAQGFRALLDREGSEYTIEKIAAKTGKAASFIAKRLKLLDLTRPRSGCVSRWAHVSSTGSSPSLRPKYRIEGRPIASDGDLARTTR